MSDGKIALGLTLIALLVGVLLWLPVLIKGWIGGDDE